MQINALCKGRPLCGLVSTKIVRVMRLTAYLMLAFCMHVSAKGVSQTVTFSGSNVPLKQVFAEIKEQTGYLVFYDREALVHAKPVTLRVKDAPLQSFLQQLLAGQMLDFSIREKNIILRKKDMPVASVIMRMDITGVVVDKNGALLPGALIRVKNTKKAIFSDGDGKFVINADEGDVLEITYLGFEKKEVPVGSLKIMRIVLEPAVSALDEAVVQAYGLTSKRTNTGNIDKVNGKEIEQTPVNNPIAALQGRVPGVVITQASGVPGGGFKVQIRGNTQVDPNVGASDEPLYIVDGIPLASGENRLNRISSAINGSSVTDGLSALGTINAADVESIEILKDADATAIYGSRGASGVVLITTRRGKSGQTSVNANFSTGFSKAPMPDLLNTQQYVAMRKEAFANDNIAMTNSNAYDILLWDTTRDNNLAKQLIGGTARMTNGQIVISGGTDRTQYRVSTGYTRETDVFPGEMPNERFMGNFSLNTRSDNQKFNAAITGSYTSSINRTAGGDLSSKLNLPPNFLLYDSLGNLAWNEGGVTVVDNPLATLQKKYKARTDNLNANAMLSYRVLPDLVVRSSFGYNSIKVDELRIDPIASQNPAKANVTGSTSFGKNNFQSWIIEPQAEYFRNIGKGRLNILAGGTIQNQWNEGYNFSVNDYTSDEFLGSLTGITGISFANPSSNLNQYKYAAFFGRINYNYDNKYILNLTGRRDGSSRFGPEFRFSNFAAAGAAWLFTNEPFMQFLPALSFGKLRASYGVTGNDKIGDYKYLDAYTANAFYPNYQDSAAFVPSGLFKPDLHWERNVKLEFALELGFMKDRLLVSAAWYKNRTSDPLVNYPLPQTTGFSGISANLNGVLVDNKGVELMVTSQNIRKKDFNWTTNFNITVPDNKLVAYPGLAQSSHANRYEIGKSLNLVRIARFTGIDQQTGLWMIEDVDKDNRFTTAGDFQSLFDTDPEFYGGLDNNIRYKGLQVSFLLQFTRQMGKNWMASQATSGFQTMTVGGMQNLPSEVLGRWQQEGDITRIQKFTTRSSTSTSLTGNYAANYSDLGYMDAAYLRLKNASISYFLPERWIKRAKMTQARVYAQGQNLLTFTPVKGTDPETVYLFRLPPLRTVTFGVQLYL